MTDATDQNNNENTISKEIGEEVQMESLEHGMQEQPMSRSGNFREGAYFVLFIAAVFIINAMETGSYRTPWPVAIITLIIGLGLLAYSFFKPSGS